ncbi:MAG TPA: hypothetical protein VFV47_15175, partial [Hyphomicrobiaceae bacterium]|nr:hypothetical protein [Hyphomicrobiaceae bacterium]
IWIGHRDDHRAWDQLSDARDAFDRLEASVPADARDRALEELLIAEGSDWFWWYGDDHSSDHDADFDDLFRRHLRNAYAALGAPIPEELFATNISTGSGPFFLEPSGLLSITLDGRDTSYLEWVGAVSPSLSRPGGAMHEVNAAALIQEIRVGVSREALCIRLDAPRLTAMIAAGSASLALVMAGPEVRVIPIDRSWLGAGSIVELAVPFNRLITDASATDIQFAIQVRDGSDAVLETVPNGRSWSVRVPNPDASTTDWQA